MKPAPFRYVRPGSLDEALTALAAEGGEAKVLAGGQSLVPAMNFRLAQPAVLIDLNPLESLAGITPTGTGLRIGAMTRQRTLETSPLVAAETPLVAEAMPFVAHVPIRTRGTIGGSLAHGDPAAELPALMLALDATFGVRSLRGAREIPARSFFTGLFATALEPDEIITHVTVPAKRARCGWAFDEVARRHGDFALAGAAAFVALDERGRIETVRLALLGVHDRPVLAEGAARLLAGQPAAAEAIREAAEAAASGDAEPVSDLHASRAYRRHLVGVLARRVLARAVDRARNG